MQAVLTGVYGLYNGNATLKAALTGGLYIEQVPQGISIPYAVMYVTSGRPDYFFADEVFEIIDIQFDIYAQTNAIRQDIYGKLIAVFDDAKPTITGYTSHIMEREYYQMLRTGDNDEGYRAIVQYQLTIEKN